VNALVDDGNNSTSPNSNKRPNEDEISDQLLHVPIGHHYLILYPDLETMRKVYSKYVKKQLEEQPNSVVIHELNFQLTYLSQLNSGHIHRPT